MVLPIHLLSKLWSARASRVRPSIPPKAPSPSEEVAETIVVSSPAKAPRGHGFMSHARSASIMCHLDSLHPSPEWISEQSAPSRAHIQPSPGQERATRRWQLLGCFSRMGAAADQASLQYRRG